MLLVDYRHPWIIRLSVDDYVIHGSVSYISWAKIPQLPHGIHEYVKLSMDIVCLDFHSAAVNAATTLITIYHAIVSHIIALADSSSFNKILSLSLTPRLIFILISYFIIALYSYSHY